MAIASPLLRKTGFVNARGSVKGRNFEELFLFNTEIDPIDLFELKSMPKLRVLRCCDGLTKTLFTNLDKNQKNLQKHIPHVRFSGRFQLTKME